MENRAHALTAGLFVMALTLAAGLALWWLSADRVETRSYELVTEGSLTGLNEQAQVRYRGIRAGKVEAIDIDPENPRHILIRIALRQDLPVTRGTRASLGYQGVTGIAFVQLTDKGEDLTPLPAGPAGLPRLALQPGLMEQLSDTSLETMRKVQVVVDQLASVLDQANLARVSRILVRLESASEGVDRTFQAAPQALAGVRSALSPENLAHLNSTLARLDEAGQEVAPAVRELKVLTVKLQGLSERIDQLAGTANRQVAQGTLPRLDGLLDELTETSRRMGRLIDEVEASPQVLIFGRSGVAPGPGEAGFQPASGGK